MKYVLLNYTKAETAGNAGHARCTRQSPRSWSGPM
jgi:hypothetical protein